MQIKRFEAKNMTEALALIKRDLGPEAVILSARDVRRENRLLGLSRKVGVEVTAAVDDKYPPSSVARTAASPGAGASASAGQAIGIGVRQVHDVVRLSRSRSDSQWRSTPAARTPLLPSDSNGLVLASSERRQKPASSSGGVDPAPPQPIAERLQAMGLKLTDWPGNSGKPLCVALVGSAGVGKSVTVAKLAAHLRYEAKRSVGLISLDHCKIGGVATLRDHAAIMGLKTHDPRCLKSLRKALRRLQSTDVILIDTPAVDSRGGEASIPLLAAMPSVMPVTVWLVVSAETKEEDLRDAAQRVANFAPSGVILTKTDLTRSFAAALNFLCQSGLPLAWLGTGSAIPHDLDQATYNGLAERLVKHGEGQPVTHIFSPEVGQLKISDQTIAPESDETYWANKSSDIFHRAGCKWIRLINRDHIVAFGSFAEALNNRFKPCRYCNPQSMPLSHMLREEQRAN